MKEPKFGYKWAVVGFELTKVSIFKAKTRLRQYLVKGKRV